MSNQAISRLQLLQVQGYKLTLLKTGSLQHLTHTLMIVHSLLLPSYLLPSRQDHCEWIACLITPLIPMTDLMSPP